jgi:hypothetical protein
MLDVRAPHREIELRERRGVRLLDPTKRNTGEFLGQTEPRPMSTQPARDTVDGVVLTAPVALAVPQAREILVVAFARVPGRFGPLVQLPQIDAARPIIGARALLGAA